MKAQNLRGINDIRYEDINFPEVKDNEVLVRVKAAGICGSDIPRIFHTGAHVHPIVPGHEFSGEVLEAEYVTEEQKKWIGKAVGVFPLIPCRKCGPCKIKKFEMCRNYNYLGSRSNGGFAEYVAVPIANLIELPKNVSFRSAAMLEPMAVAVHAMRGFEFSLEDTVCVSGLGTIGLMLVMFLKAKGVKNLLVLGNKDFQRENAIKLGINPQKYCDIRKEAPDLWIKETTKEKGVDIYFECVGKNETISLGIDVVAPSGKIMLVGNPYSDMNLDKGTYWKILRNQLSIKGTWNSSFTGEEDDDWHYVLKQLSTERIEPENLITHIFAMKDLQQGLNIMKNKTEDYIKIIGEN